jgi:hypothetical protein
MGSSSHWHDQSFVLDGFMMLCSACMHSAQEPFYYIYYFSLQKFTLFIANIVLQLDILDII